MLRSLLHKTVSQGCRQNLTRWLSTQSNATVTVDNDEIHKFDQQANKWWNERGTFAALHTMNKMRIPLVKGAFDQLDSNSVIPLVDKTILDVGCGGGILSEPLARLGASVTGIDASVDGIDAALNRKTCLEDPKLENLNYVHSTIEEFAEGKEETFDVVVASEVLEHVASLDSFIECCVKLIKPGGSMVITTINKTQFSYWIIIMAAEYLLNIVPKGTHDWNKFVEPQHLRGTFEKYGYRQTLLHGMTLNPVTLQWSWTDATEGNYAARFTKIT